MKYFFYLPFLVLFFSCQNDTATTAVAAADTTTETTTMTTTTGEQPEMSYEFKPAGAPGLSDPRQALINGIWVIEGYVEVGNKDAQQQNASRWFNFNENGQYERGRFSEKRGSGKWTYETDGNLLTMEDGEGAFNSQFKVRLTPNGQTMIIVGTNRYNQTRIQGKLTVQADYPKQ